ncbi:hypothetical protein [Paraliomyxa miuraensis]|uniref:hypothetical protein n=1 Tax=Paraliomyxa miuraensis TaxID=376150 RepID=UPI00225B0D8E|nr:hypothetical protein [Paraliomyxa miuraensis]MCX4244701.1 hypothetical protein [Paraliomyxa miuraensis]
MAPRTLSLYTILFAIVLALGACKKDDFANETMAQLAKVTDDIVAKVKESEDKKAGVAEAQKILDAAKGDLGPKMKEIMELRGFQLSEEAQGNVAKVMVDVTTKMASMEIDLMTETMSDKDLETAVEKLSNDHEKLVMGE